MTRDLRFLRDRPFAHRGLHDMSAVPENSLRAVDRAVRAGLGVEVDVRLSRDGVPVVFHDAQLGRLCGAAARVVDRDYAELRGLRLAGGDERIPRLSQVLTEVAGTVPLLLDLKCGVRRGERRALAAAVAQSLRGYDGAVATVSFDPFVLRALAVEAPHVPRGQSAGIPRLGLPAAALLLPAARPVDGFWLNALSLPHFVTFNVDRLPFASLQAARDRGVCALGWTVRSAEQLLWLARAVDNVIVEGPIAHALAG